MATSQAQVSASATVVPVISTWTSGSSTWTATDHYTTVFGPAPPPTAAPSPTSSVSSALPSSSSSSSSTASASKPSRKPDRTRLSAMAIISARNKAVSASGGSGNGGGAAGTSSGASGGDASGQWVLPGIGQIFAGGQDVTLSWRSEKRPAASTMLRLCVLKDEGALRAAHASSGNEACGQPTAPTIMKGAQAGVWSISFTAPNVTIADSFYVLLSQTGSTSSSPTTTLSSSKATTTKSATAKSTATSKAKAKAAEKADRKQRQQDRKDQRKADRNGSGSGSGSDEDDVEDDDDDEGDGDEYESYDDEEDSSSSDSDRTKGWSSLRRERSLDAAPRDVLARQSSATVQRGLHQRSHDAEDSPSSSSTGSGSSETEDNSSMLSPAFVLAPYGSNTNPAAIQMAATDGSTSSSSNSSPNFLPDGTPSTTQDGGGSGVDATRPGPNLPAILIPLLLVGCALVGALALLMYRRGRRRAADEAERLRSVETQAREKAKAEMRDILRRSGSSSLALAGAGGAGGFRRSGLNGSICKSLGGGSSWDGFGSMAMEGRRRSYMTPSPSYRSQHNGGVLLRPGYANGPSMAEMKGLYTGSGGPYPDPQQAYLGHSAPPGGMLYHGSTAAATESMSVPILPYHHPSASASASTSTFTSAPLCNIPPATTAGHDDPFTHHNNQGLQSRDSVHSLSGKSYTSASTSSSSTTCWSDAASSVLGSSTGMGMGKRREPVWFVVPPVSDAPAGGTTIPCVPPPVHTSTPPLPPPTPPKDDLFQRAHPPILGQPGAGVMATNTGVPLVRSGSLQGGSAVMMTGMGTTTTPSPPLPMSNPTYAALLAHYQHQLQQQPAELAAPPLAASTTTVPKVTFTSPTASSPTSSLWARVTNPFGSLGSTSSAESSVVGAVVPPQQHHAAPTPLV
ncbi:hypothetical protein V8E36_006652 [Tilletia maclaganii]